MNIHVRLFACPAVAQDRVRALMGQEAMRLQGLFLPQFLYEQFDDRLVHDMAGNAFNAPTACAPLGSLLMVAAKIFEKDNHALDEFNGFEIDIMDMPTLDLHMCSDEPVRY